MAAVAWLLAGAGAASFVVSLGLTAAARRVAMCVGYVDRPGGHKSHRAPTPYGGGVAIFLATWSTLLIGVQAAPALVDWASGVLGPELALYVQGIELRTTRLLLIAAGAVTLFALGLVDDARPLGPGVKFIAILLVALLTATLARVRLAEFAGSIGAIALTTLWIVIITNSLNFLDNMDGLSGGVTAIAAAFLAAAGVMAGQVFVPALAAVLCGAVCGFLVFNFPPARIFMGDAGSLVNGYLLSVIAVLTSYYDSGSGAPPYALAMPLIVLAIPLYDFTSVVVIRLFEGRNPFRGDQRHFSHRLVDRGLSRRMAVLTIYLATAATGLLATLLPGAGLRETLTVVAATLMVLLMIAILEAPLRNQA